MFILLERSKGDILHLGRGAPRSATPSSLNVTLSNLEIANSKISSGLVEALTLPPFPLPFPRSLAPSTSFSSKQQVCKLHRSNLESKIAHRIRVFRGTLNGRQQSGNGILWRRKDQPKSLYLVDERTKLLCFYLHTALSKLILYSGDTQCKVQAALRHLT